MSTAFFEQRPYQLGGWHAHTHTQPCEKL